MTPLEIEAEHDRLGLKLGWRFLMCPEARLDDADVAIVTLNPGGTRRVDTKWSQELGNAYQIESWGGAHSGGDALQRQVQRLCALLGRPMDRVLAATFVPFRSPDWKSLPRQQEAVAFSRDLWKWALDRSPAKLFVCVGKDVVGRELAHLLGAQQLPSASALWGNQTIDLYKANDGKVIVALPHLGRFKLFGKAERDKAFKDAIEGLWNPNQGAPNP
jgi:hypothetical protein